jgi:hypothetical protein
MYGQDWTRANSMRVMGFIDGNVGCISKKSETGEVSQKFDRMNRANN